MEGNIGCGKTTMLNLFQQYSDTEVIHFSQQYTTIEMCLIFITFFNKYLLNHKFILFHTK